LTLLVCVDFSDRHGMTADDLAWHPAMKEVLRTPVLDSSLCLNKVSSLLLCICHSHSLNVMYVFIVA